MTPGFVDIHSHYDAQVFWDPALTPSSFHGVTTVIAGQLRLLHRAVPTRAPRPARPDAACTSRTWTSTRSPRASRGTSRRSPSTSTPSSGTALRLNYGVYVGHTAHAHLRHGRRRATSASPTDDELRAMQAIVRDAMEAGAMGFATSSSGTHNGDQGRPVPSRRADLAELEALLQPLRELGQGSRRAPARREDQARRRLRPPGAHRPPAHLDGAPHGEGLSLARGDHRGQQRGTRGRRCRSGRRSRSVRWRSR